MTVDDGFVNYEAFGAIGDGVTDDLPAIGEAHAHANAHGLSVRTRPDATYHLGGRAITVKIATDTDWNTSRFTIDDTRVEDHKAAIFDVCSLLEPEVLHIARLVRDQPRVDARLERDCHVLVENDNRRVYIRRGRNRNNGTPQHEPSRKLSGTLHFHRDECPAGRLRKRCAGGRAPLSVQTLRDGENPGTRDCQREETAALAGCRMREPDRHDRGEVRDKMTAKVMMKATAMLAAIVLPWLASAVTWTGGAGTDWFNTNNWDTTAVPGAGASVTVPTGKTILLTNETAELATFTMAGGTLTFSNWTTRLRATEVAIDGGTLTLPPAFSEAQMSNRVWIVCSNFTLAAGASIDAQGRGYIVGQGVGKGNARGGAGHGGLGGAGNSTAWANLGKIYGDPAFPLAPGSGGGTDNATGTGGGAVRIQASGQATVHGTISVSGNATASSSNGGAGSGGSILIECRTFGGSATGLLTASGGNGGTVSGGRAAGGRIAVIYDVEAQALLAEPNPPVRFQAEPGTGGSSLGAYTVRPGTLYLPDTQFLSADMSAARWLNVVIVIPNLSTWSPASLSVGGKIAFQNLVTLAVQGALTITNGGSLTLFGTPSHPEFAGAGQMLRVGGSLSIRATGRLELLADDTRGVAPYVECGSLHVHTNGTVSADWYGFGQEKGDGKGSVRNGAGYGGRGSSVAPAGATYGVEHAPVEPGSGGGSSGDGGGRGGGLVRIGARGRMQVDGTISAAGMNRITVGTCGAGSGGGIMLTARYFAGSETGAMSANGGTISNAGGGGRIAVLTPFQTFVAVNTLSERATPPSALREVDPVAWNGWNGSPPSVTGYQSGSVFFGRFVSGTTFLVR